MSETPSTEIDGLVREAYRLGYEDRSKERDYDPDHALDLLARVVSAVLDPATGRILVKRANGTTTSLAPEEYAATRVTPPGSDQPR
jgi:hypothetical protein